MNFNEVITILLGIGIALCILYFSPSSSYKKQDNTIRKSDALTFEELKNKADEYEHELKDLTSVQLESFKRKYCNVVYDDHIESRITTIKTPVVFDDICTVKDVRKSHMYKRNHSIECYFITCTNGFEFPTSLYSGAGKLSKGQEIHINGTVFFNIDSHNRISYECKNFATFKIEETKNEKITQ